MKRLSLIAGDRSSGPERKALLSYAFFRWESAAILAMTLILAVFVRDPFKGFAFWRWWFWIVLGLFAEALIVGTTLLDPDVRARTAMQLLREGYDLDVFADIDLRERVARALSTREQIESMIQRTRDNTLAAQLRALTDDVTNWIAGIYALAMRVDDYRSDVALRRDRSEIPADIRALESRLARTTDAQARTDLERALAGKRSEWARLEHLDRLVESAVSQLDASQAALARVYTQMQLGAARGANTGRQFDLVGQQLRGDIAAHVRSLSEMGQEIAESHQQVLERA